MPRPFPPATIKLTMFFCGCCGGYCREANMFCGKCQPHANGPKDTFPWDRTWFAKHGQPCPLTCSIDG